MQTFWNRERAGARRPWPLASSLWGRISGAVQSLWRTRTLRFGLLFLPSLLAGAYYFIIASDRYESEARFVVRSAVKGDVSGSLSFLVQLGLMKSQDDSYIVQDFMTSRDAIDQLRKRLPLADIFDRSSADFLARYPSVLYGQTRERFYKYFRQMVTVVHVEQSGISTLRVEAFRPEDAQLLATTMLSISEDLINRINQRLQTDAIAASLADLESAQARLVKAQAALTEFRNSELTVDPQKNAISLAELIASLSADLASAEAQILHMRMGSAASPQLQGLQRRAIAVREQIAQERGRIATGTGGLAVRIATYERLTLEREFANKLMNSAEAELVRSRTEAARQLLYLERIVEPHLADYSTQPRRIANVLTTLAANAILVLIAWLIFSGIREHAQ